MSPRSDRHRLLDILDAVGRIERYAALGLSDLDREHPAWDAILYNLAVIGEAVKDVSPQVLELAGEVDWSKPAGMRDVVIHRYFSTDFSVVASTVERDVPELRHAVERVLDALPGG